MSDVMLRNGQTRLSSLLIYEVGRCGSILISDMLGDAAINPCNNET
jgi:hypothetical protein